MWQVYKCYDADGRALYIGCTHDVKSRLSGHKFSSRWHGELARTEVSQPMEKKAAFKAERDAIVAEKPKWNKYKIQPEIQQDKSAREYKAWLRLNRIRKTLMIRQRAKGWTLERIAKAHGVSRQRVWQIVGAK